MYGEKNVYLRYITEIKLLQMETGVWFFSPWCHSSKRTLLILCYKVSYCKYFIRSAELQLESPILGQNIYQWKHIFPLHFNRISIVDSGLREQHNLSYTFRSVIHILQLPELLCFLPRKLGFHNNYHKMIQHHSCNTIVNSLYIVFKCF